MNRSSLIVGITTLVLVTTAWLPGAYAGGNHRGDMSQNQSSQPGQQGQVLGGEYTAHVSGRGHQRPFPIGGTAGRQAR